MDEAGGRIDLPLTNLATSMMTTFLPDGGEGMAFACAYPPSLPPPPPPVPYKSDKNAPEFDEELESKKFIQLPVSASENPTLPSPLMFCTGRFSTSRQRSWSGSRSCRADHYSESSAKKGGEWDVLAVLSLLVMLLALWLLLLLPLLLAGLRVEEELLLLL